MGLLNEERARVDEEIGTEQVLDRVQDARVTDEVERPAEEQVAVVDPPQPGPAFFPTTTSSPPKK